MEALDKLKEILSKRNIDVDHIKASDKLDELGLDSLDTVEIMLEIEEYVGQEFSTDEISSIHTVQDVLDLINNKMK